MTIHWYRADVTRPTHPKLKKLARRLGVTRMHAIGIHEVLCVIPAVAGRSDGCLGSMDAEDLAIAVDWEGDHETLLETLVALAILDRDPDGSLYVHGFAERATKEAAKRERDRDRKRADRRVDGDGEPEPIQSSPRPVDVRRTEPGHEPVSRGNSARTNERTNGQSREDRARAPEPIALLVSAGTATEVASPTRPALQASPSASASSEAGSTPADAATTQRGGQDATRARPTDPPPLVDAVPEDAAQRPDVADGGNPDDVLDYLSDFGAREAVAIYNAHRHPSLPAWDLDGLGVPSGVLLTMSADAMRERKTGSAAPWPMHRRSGWLAFAERTHGALWLHEPEQRYDLAWWFRGARRGAVECEGFEKRQALFAGRYKRGRAAAPTSGRSLADNAMRILEAERRARGAGTHEP